MTRTPATIIFKVPVREAVRRVGEHVASGVDAFDAFDEAAFLSVTQRADDPEL